MLVTVDAGDQVGGAHRAREMRDLLDGVRDSAHGRKTSTLTPPSAAFHHLIQWLVGGAAGLWLACSVTREALRPGAGPSRSANTSVTNPAGEMPRAVMSATNSVPAADRPLRTTSRPKQNGVAHPRAASTSATNSAGDIPRAALSATIVDSRGFAGLFVWRLLMPFSNNW